MTDLTKIDKPFGELDRETQLAMFEAWLDGARIQGLAGTWKDWGTPSWASRTLYRVRPEPLTLDSIDWSHVTPQWRFMARGVDGCAVIYQSLPHIFGNYWKAPQGVGSYANVLASYRRGTVDWRDSLVVRP